MVGHSYIAFYCSGLYERRVIRPEPTGITTELVYPKAARAVSGDVFGQQAV
jgi:hypothetical protein